MAVLVSVEGNIGAGKSTLLKVLEGTKFQHEHTIMYEPVDEWMDVRPDGPLTPSLFEKYYSDKKKYGFVFQMYALYSRLKNMQKVIEDNPGKIIICERTHYTDCNIFAKMLMNSGFMDKCEFYVYNKWFEECERTLNNCVKGIIYLQVSPGTCMTRIAKRNRTGEDNISINYINTLHNLHEDWLSRQTLENMKVCLVNGDCPQEVINYQNIVDFINSLSLGHYKS